MEGGACTEPLLGTACTGSVANWPPCFHPPSEETELRAYAVRVCGEEGQGEGSYLLAAQAFHAGEEEISVIRTLSNIRPLLTFERSIPHLDSIRASQFFRKPQETHGSSHFDHTIDLTALRISSADQGSITSALGFRGQVPEQWRASPLAPTRGDRQWAKASSHRAAGCPQRPRFAIWQDAKGPSPDARP